MKKVWLLIILTIVLFPAKVRSQTFTFDFSTDFQGWSGDFADYPVADSIFYELDFKRITLPEPLDTGKYALMINGSNHSDDLFMFIKRKITGLTPNKIYKLLIDIELASDAPTNAVGIGGAPGESVFLKAGATLKEPKKVKSDGYYLMNIDKSNQALPGPDMDTLGHIGVSDTTSVFTLINRTNAGHLFTISTDDDGAVWVCIGTDSGFEGTTTLYYNKIILTFDNMTGENDSANFDDSMMFPNPVKDILVIKTGSREIRSIELINVNGQSVSAVRNSDRISVKNILPGTYSLRVTYTDNSSVTKKIIVQ
ncbi:MAG: T9SS type A sorting domain-containing protein [Bacteroidia bacterium]|nr:T9SS type A sorting domain-containing protein [Bacteroidia bacterium]